MQQLIDINLFKENPHIFFNHLDKDTEKEFINLLEYFIFKYDIHIDYRAEVSNSKQKTKNEFLDFIESNKINLPENFKFDREEANER
jgi:hypothetical protein